MIVDRSNYYLSFVWQYYFSYSQNYSQDLGGVLCKLIDGVISTWEFHST